MKLSTILLLVSMLILSPASLALEFMDKDVVTINEPIEDDLFASGNSIYINAPVDSAVVAGGTIEINAPIKGDLIAAGGQVEVNSDIGGKIVAAGGTIKIRGDVARNVVLAGGQIRIDPGSKIGRDALISGGNVYNGGDVKGKLWVGAENFQNEGTAGDLKTEEWDYEKERDSEWGIGMFGILWILGFLFTGLTMLKVFPDGVYAVDGEIKDSPAIKALIGFSLIIGSIILIFISMITIIGMPLALILLALFTLALLLANLFVSFSLGRWIAAIINKEVNDIVAFIAGFIILNILFVIPFVGWVIELVSISLGFGAIFYALNRKTMGTKITTDA